MAYSNGLRGGIAGPGEEGPGRAESSVQVVDVRAPLGVGPADLRVGREPLVWDELDDRTEGVAAERWDPC